MPFNRIEASIIGRLPHSAEGWVAFAIPDDDAEHALEAMTASGSVERKARVIWTNAQGDRVTGYALLIGEWRHIVADSPEMRIVLHPAERTNTLLRATAQGDQLRNELRNADCPRVQGLAIAHILDTSTQGVVRLFHDEHLQHPCAPMRTGTPQPDSILQTDHARGF